MPNNVILCVAISHGLKTTAKILVFKCLKNTFCKWSCVFMEGESFVIKESFHLYLVSKATLFNEEFHAALQYI